MGSLPLTGIRVIDLTSNIAAPFAGAVLADLGAEVLHVESLSGDDSRRMAPRIDEISAYWQVVNRNKKVTRLDIRQQDQMAVLQELIAGADVFLSNLRPEKLAKNGLDYRSLKEVYPKLIHGALSAYGELGIEQNRAGYDAVLQARTGIAQVTGTSDGPPVRAGVSILDIGAGTWLALAVITALFHREKTGEGSNVATSLFETGANWVSYHVAAHQVTGETSGRFGSGHPAFSPYGIFPTKTAQVCIGIGGDSIFRSFCNALSLEYLLDDEDYATNPARVKNDRKLRLIIEEKLSNIPAEEIVTNLEQAGVACDIVQNPEDLLADPQAIATEIMLNQKIAGFGELKFPGLPITFNGQRPVIRAEFGGKE